MMENGVIRRGEERAGRHDRSPGSRVSPDVRCCFYGVEFPLSDVLPSWNDKDVIHGRWLNYSRIIPAVLCRCMCAGMSVLGYACRQSAFSSYFFVRGISIFRSVLSAFTCYLLSCFMIAGMGGRQAACMFCEYGITAVSSKL